MNRSWGLYLSLLCVGQAQLFLSSDTTSTPEPPESPTSYKTFWSSLWAALLMILATELGDKTFIIAAVLAGKKPRLAIFLGGVLVLSLMSIVSSFLGFVFVQILSPLIITIVACCCFVLFSILSFKEACSKDDCCDEEELAEKIEESAEETKKRRMQWLAAMWQCMCMVFFAEWGDKTQLGTITLVAECAVEPVVIGAILGFIITSALAVIGGRWIASFFSEKTMAYIAGCIFLVFAVLVVLLE